MKKEELNSSVYKKLIDSAELLLKKEHDRNIMVIDAFDWMDEIVQNEDLNQVSDIFIYEEGFGNLNEDLKNTLFHAISTVIAKYYSDDNISYLENLILADEEKKNDVALDLLLRIGRYQIKFKDRIFDFIEQNFNLFSKNKLNVSAFYMAAVYKNDRAMKLFREINELHSERYPSEKSKAEQNMNSEPDESHNDAKPWWKFW